MIVGEENDRWAYLLIDQLVQQGIDHFYIAPGSRSTPLLLAISSHPGTKPFIHFDERGIAFRALGFGKEAKKPAVLVTTSGTAVANTFPAVMEASHAQIPLLLLTVDRPAERYECGSNQTCDQVKLFGRYV